MQSAQAIRSAQQAGWVGAKSRWPVGLKAVAKCWVWALLGLTSLGMAPLRAQPADAEPTLVGQLAATEGQVWLFDRDLGEWRSSRHEALRNWPLTSGDRLRTDGDARAVLRLASVTVRLAADAELELARVATGHLVFRLWRGSASWHVLDDAQAGWITLLADPGRVMPQRAGHYRLDQGVHQLVVTAWRGEARVLPDDGEIVVKAGRQATLIADPSGGPLRIKLQASQPDGFAEWALREAREDSAPVAARQLPGAVSGWQELDRHGRWREDRDWGWIWLPGDVPAGWQPYRDGRWVWVGTWGWTWLDASPWGFVTVHYGRWIPWRGRWAWQPEPRHQPPKYRPVPPGLVPPPPRPDRHIGPRERWPGDRPGAPHAERPADRPSDPWRHRPPGDRPGDRPGEHSGDRIVGRPGDRPAPPASSAVPGPFMPALPIGPQRPIGASSPGGLTRVPAPTVPPVPVAPVAPAAVAVPAMPARPVVPASPGVPMPPQIPAATSQPAPPAVVPVRPPVMEPPDKPVPRVPGFRSRQAEPSDGASPPAAAAPMGQAPPRPPSAAPTAAVTPQRPVAPPSPPPPSPAPPTAPSPPPVLAPASPPAPRAEPSRPAAREPAARESGREKAREPPSEAPRETGRNPAAWR